MLAAYAVDPSETQRLIDSLAPGYRRLSRTDPVKSDDDLGFFFVIGLEPFSKVGRRFEESRFHRLLRLPVEPRVKDPAGLAVIARHAPVPAAAADLTHVLLAVTEDDGRPVRDLGERFAGFCLRQNSQGEKAVARRIHFRRHLVEEAVE